MSEIEALLRIAKPLSILNEGQPEKISDKFPVLKTNETKSDVWWDSLNTGQTVQVCGRTSYINKITVGEIVLHYKYMSARYPWDCSETKYDKLSKGMKKRIDAVFKRRYEKYSIFDLMALFNLQKM